MDLTPTYFDHQELRDFHWQFKMKVHENWKLTIHAPGKTSYDSDDAELSWVREYEQWTWPYRNVMDGIAEQQKKWREHGLKGNLLLGQPCQMDFLWKTKCRRCTMTTYTHAKTGKQYPVITTETADLIQGAGWQEGLLVPYEFGNSGFTCNASPPADRPKAAEVCAGGEKVDPAMKMFKWGFVGNGNR
jgi:hypothetical protein